ASRSAVAAPVARRPHPATLTSKLDATPSRLSVLQNGDERVGDGRGDRKGSQVAHRAFHVVRGTAQLRYAILDDRIACARVAIARLSHAPGVDDGVASNAPDHRKMRVTQQDEVGVDAG